MDQNKLKEEGNKRIWLAGGCFWGVQAYFDRVPGVVATMPGYANGNKLTPSYREIANTGHAEAVQVEYDPKKTDLVTLLAWFFAIIDPTLENRQGNDVGTQYRTGIYFDHESDREAIQKVIESEQEKYEAPIVTEVKRLENFYPAEEYHRDYLKKNPSGYCHIDLNKKPDIPLDANTSNGIVDEHAYTKPDKRELKKKLSKEQYAVTQQDATEPPFKNEYWKHAKKGIYVDVTTGEPLFSWKDKFDSSCGWPAFSKPLDPDTVRDKEDLSHGMMRTEVRSRVGDAHLGHVFEDGPIDGGGLRYCINSAAIRFVPIEEMKKLGYGYLLPYVE